MSQEEIEYNLSTIKNTYFIKIFIGIIIVIVLSFLLMTRIFNNNNYLIINDAKLVGSKVEVKSKVSGLLGNVTVAEGTNVKAGDIIAKIDVTDIVKKRNELELKLKEAKLNYAKLKATTEEALKALKELTDKHEEQIQAFERKAKVSESSIQYLTGKLQDITDKQNDINTRFDNLNVKLEQQ